MSRRIKKAERDDYEAGAYRPRSDGEEADQNEEGDGRATKRKPFDLGALGLHEQVFRDGAWGSGRDRARRSKAVTEFANSSTERPHAHVQGFDDF